MTDTTTPLPSLADRVRPIDAGRRRWSACISSAACRCSCWARRRCCLRRATASRAASPSMPAAFSRARRTVSASSPAATTAHWSRPTPTASTQSSPPTTRNAGSIRSRSGRRRRRLVGRQGRACAHQEGRGAHATRRRRPSPGLAFAPKGFRLAIAHYNGVTLWFPNASATPEKLEWKGSHLSVAFSPDGKFLVTAMQEPTLHGWRLAGRPAHAHVGLFGARALARLDRGRRIPRHVGLRAAHPLAVRRQGRADGPAADDPCPLAGARCASSPAIRASRWSRSVMPTAAWCWCASTTAR